MSSGLTREIEVLKQENLMLKSQIDVLRHFMATESLMEKELERLKSLGDGDFFRRRKEEILRLIELQARAVSCRVIFREPASWSSSFWINVGERTNKVLAKKVVAKNSPVVVGTSLVGVVEYVGYRRSRVRLISDSGLTPSVRVLRGGEQDRYVLEHVETVLDDLATRGEFKEAVDALSAVKKALVSQVKTAYLAKGELSGNSAPLWRSRGLKLHGVGFNYDFADEEGPERPLSSQTEPVIKVSDLLVTTGMDGVFPAGLRVAQVAKIELLREGASSYEIDAKAAAGSLDELVYVSVFPPLESVD
jgi:cell shape-determining protein MreC